MKSTMSNKFEFDGQCAFAVSTGKTEVKGGKHTAIINGKTYVFSNAIAKILFKILPNRIAKAEGIWSKKNQ
jgi:YHS domain-containing protein